MKNFIFEHFHTQKLKIVFFAEKNKEKPFHFYVQIKNVFNIIFLAHPFTFYISHFDFFIYIN